MVRLHRARLPAPEEVFDMGSNKARSEGLRRDDAREPRGEREPRRERESRGRESHGREAYGDSAGAVVFRMNIGRIRNADPRWIIPVICRKGSVTKQDIGEIRILERETQFEIIASSAEHFASRIRRPDTKDPEIRIELLEARHGGSEGKGKPERPPRKELVLKEHGPREQGPREHGPREPEYKAPEQKDPAQRDYGPKKHGPKKYPPKEHGGPKDFKGPRGAPGAPGRIAKQKRRGKEAR